MWGSKRYCINERVQGDRRPGKREEPRQGIDTEKSKSDATRGVTFKNGASWVWGLNSRKNWKTNILVQKPLVFWFQKLRRKGEDAESRSIAGREERASRARHGDLGKKKKGGEEKKN